MFDLHLQRLAVVDMLGSREMTEQIFNEQSNHHNKLIASPAEDPKQC